MRYNHNNEKYERDNIFFPNLKMRKYFTQWWLDLFRFDSTCTFPRHKIKKGSIGVNTFICP